MGLCVKFPFFKPIFCKFSSMNILFVLRLKSHILSTLRTSRTMAQEMHSRTGAGIEDDHGYPQSKIFQCLTTN